MFGFISRRRDNRRRVLEEESRWERKRGLAITIGTGRVMGTNPEKIESLVDEYLHLERRDNPKATREDVLKLIKTTNSMVAMGR